MQTPSEINSGLNNPHLQAQVERLREMLRAIESDPGAPLKLISRRLGAIGHPLPAHSADGQLGTKEEFISFIAAIIKKLSQL